MILFEAILLGLVLSLLTGGSLKRLSAERLVAEPVVLVMLLVQLAWPLVVERLQITCVISVIVWLLMMAALAVVLMINAPRRWMLAVAGFGIALNILVIGLNGAMPVSIRAVSETGATRTQARSVLKHDCLHEELKPDTLAPFLADVIAVPGPRWQRGVISMGDILLALGLGSWVFAACRDGGYNREG